MLPLWLKIIYSLFLLLLIPVYYKKYGPANFLWFSDIGLFGTALALWMESSMVISMMALTVLIPELAWNFDFFFRLTTGKKTVGMSHYMFDSTLPLYLRALSLFHVVLPAIMIYLLTELGYEEKSICYQPILAWMVIILTFFLTKPADNINMVFGPGEKAQKQLHPVVYLLLLMIGLVLLLYIPSHFLLRWLF